MPNNIHLEPRVAKLEAGLEILTKSVSELTMAVRDNNSSMEEKIERITVAVTQAQAPKKPDYSLFVSIAFLILALGSAVFWPLNKTGQDNKDELHTVVQKFEAHQQLNLHPVGSALLQRVEEQLQLHNQANETMMKSHIEYDNRQFTELDKKLQQEYSLMDRTTEVRMAGLETKMTQFNDKIYGRVLVLEQQLREKDAKDLDELRAWRNKASGLSSPTMAVPLIPKEIVPEVKK